MPLIWVKRHLNYRFPHGEFLVYKIRDSFITVISGSKDWPNGQFLLEENESLHPTQKIYEENKILLFSLFERLPFDCNCPFGYLIAIILQWIAVTFVQFTVMILTAVGITLYPFGIALTEDNESILHMIDRDAKVKATRLQIYQKFTEFIDLHSNTKQLSKFKFAREQLCFLSDLVL